MSGSLMNNSNKIIPPHLNAEVYRTDTTGTDTLAYLDYIRCHPDGSILIGYSELTGRYWNGGANVFKSITNARKVQRESRKNISLTSSTTDGCFIGTSSKVILCEDSGAVSVWSTSDEVWNIWNVDATVAEHDSSALVIECLQPEQEYITAGADGNIKVWDINEMLCIRNYIAAHSREVYTVATRPKSNSSFASGSLDGYISLWADNTAHPVLDVTKNNCGIRCLEWLNQNQLLYGDEAGVLKLVDLRNSDSPLKLTEFPAAVHRIAVQPESERIAVCCDNKIVSVCTIEDETCKIVYHDRHMHENYVRGLAWDITEKNMLHTVGWDSAVRTHNIV